MENIDNLKRDVFISWTGEAVGLKNNVKRYLEKNNLSYYDSEVDCYGEFRRNYFSALEKSKVYLVLLTNGLLNESHYTEVRREIEFACELEAKGKINVVIVAASKYFYFNDIPSENDTVGRFIYEHLAIFKRSAIRVGYCEGNYDAIEESDLERIASTCKVYIEGSKDKCITSFNTRLPLEKETLKVEASFKGREDYIEKINKAFDSGKKVVILSGMGGIGKTELAKKYAIEHGDKFICPQVIFISDNAVDEGGIKNIVFSARYTEEANYEVKALSRDMQYNNMLRKLQTLDGRVLLIVDNYNIINQPKLEDIIAKLNCKLLITTRNAKIESSEAELIRVEELPLSLARDLFIDYYDKNREYTEEELGKIDAIISAVKSHTMLVKLIAIQMREHGIGFDEELDKLADISDMAENVEGGHNEFEGNVTLKEHLKALFGGYGIGENKNLFAGDSDDEKNIILRNLSLCYYDGIKESDFRNAIGLKTINEILSLERYGLVIRKERAGSKEYDLSLHPLVSSVCASEFKPDYENSKEFVDYITAWLGEDSVDFGVVDKKRRYAEFMVERLIRNNSYSGKLNDAYINLVIKLGNAEIALKVMNKLAASLEKIDDLGTDFADVTAAELCFELATRGCYQKDKTFATVEKISKYSPLKAARCASDIVDYADDEETIEWAAEYVSKSQSIVAYYWYFGALLTRGNANGKAYKYLGEFLKDHKSDKGDAPAFYYYLKLVYALRKVTDSVSVSEFFGGAESGLLRNLLKHPVTFAKTLSIISEWRKSDNLFNVMITNAEDNDFIDVEDYKIYMYSVIKLLYDSGFWNSGRDVFTALEGLDGLGNVISYKFKDEETVVAELDKELISLTGGTEEKIKFLFNAYQTYKIIGDLGKAAECLEKRLSIAEDNLPSYHMEIAKTHLHIAELRANAVKEIRDKRVTEDILSHYIAALRIYEKTVPESARFYSVMFDYCRKVTEYRLRKYWDGDSEYPVNDWLGKTLYFFEKQNDTEAVNNVCMTIYKSHMLYCRDYKEKFDEFVKRRYASVGSAKRKKVKNKKLAEGSVYTGMLLGDIPDGEGAMHYPDGSVYSGQFTAGAAHGKGTITYANGDVYEGEWFGGEHHGYGQYFLNENGGLLCVYDGAYYCGMRQGEGRYFFRDGSVYCGEFVEGKFGGNGKLTESDGESYKEGVFENGRFVSGRVFIKYSGGSVYEGEYSNNARNGRGVSKYKDGTVYDGEWKDGKCHGEGMLTYKSGDYRKGFFENDVFMGGYARITYDNGVYEGEWNKGSRNGKGKYIYNNGATYEGEYLNGKRHGKGKAICEDGAVLEGEWKDGLFVEEDSAKG